MVDREIGMTEWGEVEGDAEMGSLWERMKRLITSKARYFGRREWLIGYDQQSLEVEGWIAAVGLARTRAWEINDTEKLFAYMTKAVNRRMMDLLKEKNRKNRAGERFTKPISVYETTPDHATHEVRYAEGVEKALVVGFEQEESEVMWGVPADKILARLERQRQTRERVLALAHEMGSRYVALITMLLAEPDLSDHALGRQMRLSARSVEVMRDAFATIYRMRHGS